MLKSYSAKCLSLTLVSTMAFLFEIPMRLVP